MMKALIKGERVLMLAAVLAAVMMAAASSVFADTETWYVDDPVWGGVTVTNVEKMYVTQETTAVPEHFYEDGVELTFRSKASGREFTYKYVGGDGSGFYYFDEDKGDYDWTNYLDISHMDAGSEPAVPGVGHYTKVVIKECYSKEPVMGLPESGIAAYATFVVRIVPYYRYTFEYIYDGKTHIPTVSAVYTDIHDNEITVPESDYTVVNPSKSKEPGEYYLNITYNDTKYIDLLCTPRYIIRPVSPKIIKVSAAKKKATVKWKKFTASAKKHIDGFAVEYSTDKNFKKGVKCVYVSKKSASKTIKKLKSKKTYYFRVCTYVKMEYGRKLLSKPGTAKKAKIK